MKQSIAFVMVLVLCWFPGCSRKDAQQDTLTLGAFTVPKEAYQKEIIPAFKEFWKEKTGRTVKFAESYEASGAQSRAALSLFAFFIHHSALIVHRSSFIIHHSSFLTGVQGVAVALPRAMICSAFSAF